MREPTPPPPPYPPAQLRTINKAFFGPSRHSFKTPKWYEIKREKNIYTCWQRSETIRKASQAGGRNKQQPIRLGGAVSRCLRRARGGGVRCEQECIIVFPARVALRPRAVHDTFLAHIFSRNLSSWIFFFSCFISRLFFQRRPSLYVQIFKVLISAL